MANTKVFCKYLGVPLDNVVYGIVYGTPDKSRLVGPFLSLGVAGRYYVREFEAGKLRATKYGQYLYNICEQLGLLIDPTNEPLFRNTNKEGQLVMKTKAEIVKNYTLLQTLVMGKFPPPVESLETYGGTLTRKQYVEADPTTGRGLGFYVKNYLEQKVVEQQRRKTNRSQGKPKEFSLYAIEFDKNKTDLEQVHRIDINNPFFQTFVTGTKSLHIRTQKFKNGGMRIIFSAGQNINNRATRLLYPGVGKSERDALRIKGMCFVITTPNADLKLQGFLPVDTEWKPHFDKPDNVKDKEEEEESESDSESDSDEDSDSEEEVKPPQIVVVQPPAPVQPPLPVAPVAPVPAQPARRDITQGATGKKRLEATTSSVSTQSYDSGSVRGDATFVGTPPSKKQRQAPSAKDRHGPN